MVCQDCSASSRLYTYNLPDSDDIQNRLRTDFNPSASQLYELKEMIRCAEDDLKAYRAEILRLESKIMVLSTKSDLLEKHTEKLRSLVSPMRRLPNEVLGHIFFYCCETRFYVSSSWRHSNPFLSVCSWWWEVGLTTPQIWTVIYLESSSLNFSESDFTHIEAALRRYIQLSRECPLDITISEVFEWSTCEKMLWQMLVHCANRWKRLSLKTTGEEVFTLPDLPMLEMLNIDNSSACPKFATKIQTLRHFSVRAFPAGDATTFVTWENITSLKLHLEVPKSVDPPHLFDVVERCVNLVTLEYKNVPQYWSRYRDELQPFFVPQVSTSVKNLKFSLLKRPDEPGGTTLELFLNSLTFTSLKSLSLLAEPYSSGSGHQHLDVNNCRPFFDRSARTITSLTLQGFVMTDQELLSLLAVLPALTDLNVHEDLPKFRHPATITETFLEGLHSDNFSPSQSSAQPLLPRLQRLSLKVNGSWFVETMFVKMIMSRWLPQGPDLNPGMNITGTSSGSNSGPQATVTFPVQCLQWVRVHVKGRRVDRAIWKQLDSLETCSAGGGTRLKVLLIDEDPQDYSSSRYLGTTIKPLLDQ